MKKLFLIALIITTALMASASVTVNVSTPANSSTVSSSFQVAANASTSSWVTGWHIYADGVSVYTGGATGSIAPTINLSSGTHNLVVRAWAADGSYGSQSRTVAVGSSTSNGQVSVNVSAPANNATVSSSMPVSATASTSGASITGWVVYVDGATKYVGPATGSINANIAMAAGTHNVVVRAWNSYGNFGSQTRTVNVSASNPTPNPTALKINTSSLPNATAGSGYSATLSASGGTAPYKWSIVAGSLPAGLTLSSTGAISGNATTANTTGYFTAQAKDSAGSPQAATQALSISVNAAAGGATPPPQASGYSLKFSDDFNSLNMSPNGNGSGYNWYNPGVFWNSPAPYSHITDPGGYVHLNWTPGQGGSDTSLSTGSQNGANVRAWRYGYFEVRMRWNATTGAWPAIWLIPTAGYSGANEQGELDIFEGQGAYPHTYYGTIHHWLNKQSVGSNSNNTYNLGSNVDFSQWHTYGCLWEPGKVTWYFDNQPLMSASTYSIFDQQNYYLIIGSQEGANWSYGNMSGVSASSIWMDVDWVHVWQK